MIYIDIAPKSSFHPRYRIFPTLLLHSLVLSLFPLLYLYATYVPRHRHHPRTALYTKQSNLEPVARTTAPTRDCVRWQFIYPSYLCNNLLTRYIFFARETTFPQLCTSAACYRERVALLRDYPKNCASSYIRHTALKAQILSPLTKFYL